MELASYKAKEVEKLSNERDPAFTELNLEYLRSHPDFLEDRILMVPKVTGEKGRRGHRKPLQTVHTPLWLSDEIIQEWIEIVKPDKNVSILTLNLEFIVSLLGHGVEQKNIVLMTDNMVKANLCEKLYNKVEVIRGNFLEKETEMKFNVVIMNPPYQGDVKKRKRGSYKGSSDARNNLLWPEFASKGIDLCEEGGHCIYIHPPKWRKPEDKMWPEITRNQIEYLEIHNKVDGKKTFNTTTRYDWYILHKVPCYKPTLVVGEDNKAYKCDLRKANFIPNYNFDEINKIVATGSELTLDVIYSTPYHHQNSKRMSLIPTPEYKYPCIHAIRATGDMTLWYSKTNKKGHFGIKKVILNDGETLYPYIDARGDYGMTEHCFAIKVNSKDEADNIKKAIETKKFKELMKAVKWSSYMTEYRIFKYFKRDFWKEFV